jgi:hypothetical protein
MLCDFLRSSALGDLLNVSTGLGQTIATKYRNLYFRVFTYDLARLHLTRTIQPSAPDPGNY